MGVAGVKAVSSSRWVLLIGIALIMGLLAVFVVAYLRAVWDEPSGQTSGGEYVPSPRPISTPFISPGLRQPPLTPARDALIHDEDEVVGLTVGAVARAYHLRSMDTISRCVINDLLDDMPVSVTYDRQHDVVQVFTRKGSREPLPMEVGGVFQGRLLLRLDGQFFFQANGHALGPPDQPTALLVETMPFQRLPWKAWRQRYPNCQVFHVVR
jgi:hypothetical protein